MKCKLLCLNLVICLILIDLDAVFFAQNKTVIKPFTTAIVRKDEQNPKIFVDRSTEGAPVIQNKVLPKPDEVKSENTVFDTLSYRRSLGGNWDINFPIFGSEYLVMWFEAPADLTIKEIGASFSENTNNTECSFYIYKVGNGITFNDLVNVGPTEVKQGRFKSGDPIYGLGYVGFEDESDRRGYENVGNLSAFPFAELILYPGFWGYFNPIASPASAPAYQFFETKSLGPEPVFLRGEIFAIVLQNGSARFNNDRIGVWAKRTSSNPDYYGWKFYAHGKTDGDTTTVYWYSLGYTFDMAVVVDYPGDCFIRFNHNPLTTTLSTEPRIVSASIYYPYQLVVVNLSYSIDGQATWQNIPMVHDGNNEFQCTLPGFMPGTVVEYFLTATDTLNMGCTNQSTIFSYSIFKNTKDVLFVYNSIDFPANTARRLYIGGSTNTPYIVNPVDNDIWLASFGTGEAADVMALYNWVIQVDGSFPSQDFSAAAKAYLDGATESSKRNYFLSSQDYGCLIDPNCADLTFVAGDFQYDYLGLEKLGPQDLTSTANTKVQLAPVAADPLSGWVYDYNTANGVTYFYDPTFELGFTGFIDAMTPNSGGTPIFTRTNGGEVVGVRAEGANWKTAFLAFDYGANNFRSDTSLTQANDPKYVLGVEVGNQALAFLQWAGYRPSSVSEFKENIPSGFRLFQNYPNPFNPSTKISWQSPVSSWQTLKIYDVLGNEVATLVNEYKSAGSYEVEFDASSSIRNLASGIYFYQLKAGEFLQTKKMILVR